MRPLCALHYFHYSFWLQRLRWRRGLAPQVSILSAGRGSWDVRLFRKAALAVPSEPRVLQVNGKPVGARSLRTTRLQIWLRAQPCLENRREKRLPRRLWCAKRWVAKRCKPRITYYNQCVALADPTEESRRGGATQTVASAEKTIELARSRALSRCQYEAAGRPCSIVYSECSPSEFRAF